MNFENNLELTKIIDDNIILTQLKVDYALTRNRISAEISNEFINLDSSLRTTWD